jgi:hypothetical protein
MNPGNEKSSGDGLTQYERRLWAEVDRILYQNYFAPRTVTDFWFGDREAVIWHLKQIKNRVVRAIVVSEYVELADVLNRAILNGVFPNRAGQRTTKRQRVVQEMLDRLYPQQKLEVLRSFRDIPKKIASRVMALNTVRNSLAHRFILADLPKSKRLYKANTTCSQRPASRSSEPACGRYMNTLTQR